MLNRISVFARRIWRRAVGINEKCITLSPAPGTPVRGRVLLSYIIDGVIAQTDAELPHSHPHFWETRAMAESFCREGYTVDVVHWTRRKGLPRTDYDVYIDVRRNFDRFARALPEKCLKIAHMDTAHYRVHNANQQKRLEGLRIRRGIELKPFKLVETNQAAENADVITVLGNRFTMDTYEYAKKPVTRIHLSNAFTYPFPDQKDFASCRNRFMWMGSEGFVHKGLDLVLEAFRQMPDHELIVCGPLSSEPDFVRSFNDLLYQQKNIRVEGWIDVASSRFIELAEQCLGFVYPSCSEGGGGCVITGMHAGMIPVVTFEASVDITADRGILLPGDSVEEICDAVRNLSSKPPDALRDMATNAWAWARAHHSRERFSAEYSTFVKSLPSLISNVKNNAL